MFKRVLVVDDDEDMQDLLREALETESYEVMIAQDGLIALEVLEHIKPDLILLDLMMPRMDGSAFAKELRHRGLVPSVPIIVVSADVNAKQKIETMGADGYITKPFDLHSLLDEIAHFMVDLSSSEGVPIPNATSY
jgi:DNA-binding response OmpR family regulator